MGETKIEQDNTYYYTRKKLKGKCLCACSYVAKPQTSSLRCSCLFISISSAVCWSFMYHIYMQQNQVREIRSWWWAFWLFNETNNSRHSHEPPLAVWSFQLFSTQGPGKWETHKTSLQPNTEAKKTTIILSRMWEHEMKLSVQIDVHIHFPWSFN